MDVKKAAAETKDYIVSIRREFHRHPELSLQEFRTAQRIEEELDKFGIPHTRVGETGVLGTLKGAKDNGKVLVLRADIDALPIEETHECVYRSENAGVMHACGHDFHTAMLLSAAKLLKESEEKLAGRVRFMFQPAEETFEGAKDMIANGILDGVDAALAYHVSTGRMPVGIFMYNDSGTMMNSVDGFRITVYGKGSHGAYPQNSIDPINIGVHIYLALEALLAREANPNKTCVMTVGQFTAGAAANIIPDTAILQGTIRTNDRDSRALLVRRMKETAEKTAEVYGGTASVEMISEVPPLICDSALTKQIVGYMQELPIPGLVPYPGVSANASEDFASVAERVPSAFLYLSAGFLDERGDAPAHNPKVRFNEDVCPIGVSCLTHCAIRWLEENR